MKTLQDCKEKVAKRHNFESWSYLYKVCNPYRIMDDYLLKAAELYGRYMRFVAHCKRTEQVERLELIDRILTTQLAQIRSYANKPTMTIEYLRKKINYLTEN